MLRRTFLVSAAIVAARPTLAAGGDLVLVAGATGRTGRPLVNILKTKGYRVRALVRVATPATELGADDVAVGDVTRPETLPTAMAGVEFVISALGRGRGESGDVDHAGVVNLVDAAKAAGVKQFVLMSSIGAEITSATDPSVRRPETMLAKGRGEAHLRRSGLAYTIVRPGGLADCAHGQSGLSLGLISAVQYRAGGSPPVCRADVALVMAEALGNRDAMGKTLSVAGDPSSPATAWRGNWTRQAKDEGRSQD